MFLNVGGSDLEGDDSRSAGLSDAVAGSRPKQSDTPIRSPRNTVTRATRSEGADKSAGSFVARSQLQLRRPNEVDHTSLAGMAAAMGAPKAMGQHVREPRKGFPLSGSRCQPMIDPYIEHQVLAHRI
jgi:hypothetical protein